MKSDIWQCLSDVKVLDITTESGFLCGKMLADLGADVIKVELREANEMNSSAHLYGETACSEKESYWLTYNTGKRCITLNLTMAEGISLFKKLASKVSIVIESFSPGKMEDWGLGYEALLKINRRLIYTSITPFGRSGPHRDYRVTDLVAMAMGGPLFMTGDPDRPPVQVGFPQAFLHAGAEASVATLMAFYHAELTGEGQFVDVSIQESLIGSTFNAVFSWVTEQVLIHRKGSNRMIGKELEMPLTWPCKDGFVNFAVLGGAAGGKTMKNLGIWMDEEGMGSEILNGIDWSSFDFYGLTTEMVKKVAKPIARFFTKHTSGELFAESIKRGIMLFPVTNADDILADEHLEEKGFWQEMENPETGEKISYPSPPFKINNEYSPLRKKFPLRGEHNDEVYQELLGLSEQELNSLKGNGII